MKSTILIGSNFSGNGISQILCREIWTYLTKLIPEFFGKICLASKSSISSRNSNRMRWASKPTPSTKFNKWKLEWYDFIILQELLGDDGILLVPPCSSAALYHNQTLTKPFILTYTAIFNILGVPVTQVPLGLGSWGVPLGVQVFFLTW